MAIMQSCCCWRSVRRGSFACAIYSGVYFTLIVMTTGTILLEEHQYLSGNSSLPQSESVLETGVISPVTLIFNIISLICSCCGVVCCILLLYGLLKDQRFFLLPWICNVITCSSVDISHSFYLFCFSSSEINPIAALTHTLNFFLLSLNVYSLLCVISQYQEYKAGRGTAADDCEHRIPAIRYAAQPTTTVTSCLSTRRNNNENNDGKLKTTVNQTPMHSPSAFRTILSSEKSGGSKTTRKHVQFPDTPTSSSHAQKSDNTIEITGWTSENDISVAPTLLTPSCKNTHNSNNNVHS